VVPSRAWDDCSAYVKPLSFQGKPRYAFTYYQYLSPACSTSISECTRRWGDYLLSRKIDRPDKVLQEQRHYKADGFLEERWGTLKGMEGQNDKWRK
jgi:hypothetical protein